ncbi:MAG TPA: hypothetical protein VF465_08465 [Flavobacterium sp.]|uniref:hypothetical protein n=1 Tax=Flavobacterium sp. TaxID=239 RepID=UPI002ED2A0C1
MTDSSTQLTAFLSAPLVGLLDDNLKAKNKVYDEYHSFYNLIDKISSANNISVYNPSDYMDPGIHDYIRPDQIYQKNRDIIRTSDLLIAYVGIVSGGVATEIEIANSFRVPVILLCEEEKMNKVSRMILGSRMAQNHIVAPTLNDIVIKFENNLPKILEVLVEERSYTLTPQKTNLIKQLVEIHTTSQLSIAKISEEAGIDKSYLSRLLNKKISKPGRDQLIRLCAWGWKIDYDRTNDILRDAGYEPLW